MLPNQLKYFTFSSRFWCIIICTGNGCLSIFHIHFHSIAFSNFSLYRGTTVLCMLRRSIGCWLNRHSLHAVRVICCVFVTRTVRSAWFRPLLFLNHSRYKRLNSECSWWNEQEDELQLGLNKCIYRLFCLIFVEICWGWIKKKATLLSAVLVLYKSRL